MLQLDSRLSRIKRDRIAGTARGNVPIELGVPRPIHLAHSARTDLGDDLIRAETRAWSKSQRELAGIIEDATISGDYYLKIYGLPLRCKDNLRRERDERCANLCGLFVKPRLLALMESARTGPHYADGH